MRYSASQKDETRLRIVETAAREFRAHGYNGIGVADLMKSAGLTHGGFYAHFDSKDALFAESISAAFTQTRESLRKAVAQAPEEGAHAAFVDAYLSERHLQHPERGCAMVALGADVARQGPETRKAFEAQVEALIGLAESVSAAPAAGRRDEAIRTVATMLGAMLMARATHGSKLAAEVLAAARE